MGILRVDFTYETRVDEYGNALFCFTTANGSESPALHVNPGDRLLISLTNKVPEPMPASAMLAMPGMNSRGTATGACGASSMTPSSVNMHFHGTNTPPVCHQDEAIHTLINSGETFQYDVQFPWDEPPGLYWYHPHVHGLSEAAVLGGASGALIVEGIQNVNGAVAGLAQQLLIIRDSRVAAKPAPGNNFPSFDLSLNYVPVRYPSYSPAVMPMKPLEKQLWRVLNASADTIVDLQLQFDGTPQALEVVALDGVPTGSQDGAAQGRSFSKMDILLGPGARVEFMATGPSSSVQNAVLMTLHTDGGPHGNIEPTRPIARIDVSSDAAGPASRIAPISGPPPIARFRALDRESPVAERKLYFSEALADPSNPHSPVNYYITVDGQIPVLFRPDNAPSIVTTQGAVEDWTIENRAPGNHEFHIHQLHFLLLEQNGVPVNDPQYLDTIHVPYWPGTGPYPSVKVRMDFRSPLTGDFVYHCHILGHEDRGMMAIIRVKPAHGEIKPRWAADDPRGKR